LKNSKFGTSWLTRLTPLRIAVGLIVTGFLVVAILPESNLAVHLAAIGGCVTLVSGCLYGVTFWAKARVTIGRLKFRYKIIRRNAGVVTLVALSFLVVRDASISLRSSAERSTVGSPDSPSAAPPTSTMPAPPNGPSAREMSGAERGAAPAGPSTPDCGERMASLHGGGCIADAARFYATEDERVAAFRAYCDAHAESPNAKPMDLMERAEMIIKQTRSLPEQPVQRTGEGQQSEADDLTEIGEQDLGEGKLSFDQCGSSIDFNLVPPYDARRTPSGWLGENGLLVSAPDGWHYLLDEKGNHVYPDLR
jgi:hypothetical protein